MVYPIVIIGAGVAGLIAAQHLEKAGQEVLLIDREDRAGGKLLTDQLQGFQLDRGFQVLLTEYKEAKRYLDFSNLSLRFFEPGAIVHGKDKTIQLYDPLRDWGKVIPMLFSEIGTLTDKYLIWKLTQHLKSTPEDLFFLEEQASTLDFLRSYGFSDLIIEQFFRPFFGGIFLENQLATPSAMFRFVFKKFSEGKAAIPQNGMEAIPTQLFQKLTNTKCWFNQLVEKVEGHSIYFANREPIKFDRLIIATDPYHLINGLSNQAIDYHSTLNLYYELKASPLDRNAIGLVADSGNLINNYCVISDIASSYGNGVNHLLSITLKDTVEWSEDLPDRVQSAFQFLFPRKPLEFKFLSHYHIAKALPKLDRLAYDFPPTQFRLNEHIYLAGDHLLNASLDAAMRSGRRAAEALLGAK